MALVYGLGVDAPVEGRFENWPPGTRFLTMETCHASSRSSTRSRANGVKNTGNKIGTNCQFVLQFFQGR